MIEAYSWLRMSKKLAILDTPESPFPRTDSQILLHVSLSASHSHSLNKAHKANDASSWWHNDCMVTWLHEIILDLLWLWLVQLDIHGCATDRSMDWQTDGLVDRLIELQRCIKRASHTNYDNIAQKCWFPLVFDESVTDRPTDGPTDGSTDGRTDPVIEMRGRI